MLRYLTAGESHGPVGTLERLDRERRSLYKEVADHVVDVDGLEPDAVAARILELVRR